MAARTGKAQLVGLIGDPIGHSLSPRIHEYWMAAHGIDAVYVPWRQAHPDLTRLAPVLEALDLTGFNVTIPYKEDILTYATPDAMARRIGAVNTVRCLKTGWTGHNTDAAGFLASIGGKEAVAGRRAQVLGAGGAARAIVAALIEAKASSIILTNRGQARAETLAHDMAGAVPIRVLGWEDRQRELEECDLLVNATSLGMEGREPLDLALEGLPPSARIADIVYVPRETELLRAARARGLEAIDGLGMLLGQAAAAFELWFGILPTIDDALRRQLAAPSA